MSKLNFTTVGRIEPASLFWAAALIVWLVVLCFVPDPRPMGAPEWAVRGIRSLTGLSEPAARVAATISLRAVYLALIGILLALSLRHVPIRYAATLAVIVAPLLAVGVKWINFEYLPISSQLVFFMTAGVSGALAGLALRRSRVALSALVILGVGLFAWGTSTAVSNDLYEAARMTGLHVLEREEDIAQGDEGFAQLFEVAFAFAEDNSHGTGAVLPNQAAILALGVILGEDRVARVGKRMAKPGREQDRASIRHRIQVRGRNDLSRHFWVSAALTVLSGEKRATTVGVTKEMKDSLPGGSGFSFVDMVANKAGIRFAKVATKHEASARAMQLRIAEGLIIDDFFPEIEGLPEDIPRDEFQSEYGGLGGAESRRLFGEMDRRVGVLKGLQ